MKIADNGDNKMVIAILKKGGVEHCHAHLQLKNPLVKIRF